MCGIKKKCYLKKLKKIIRAWFWPCKTLRKHGGFIHASLVELGLNEVSYPSQIDPPQVSLSEVSPC